MRKDEQRKDKLEGSSSAARDRSNFEEVVSDFATFELPIDGSGWNWSPEAALLLGLDPNKRENASTGCRQH